MKAKIKYLMLATGWVYLTVFLPITNQRFFIPEASAQTPAQNNDNNSDSPSENPRAAEAEKLYETGIEQVQDGQLTEALATFKEGLTISQEIEDFPGMGLALVKVGEIYNTQIQYPQALEVYQQALAIYQKESDRPNTALTLSNVALTYSYLGQYQQAIDYYQQAVEVQKEIDNPIAVGKTLNKIGTIYRYLQQHSEALSFYRQALDVFTEKNDRTSLAATLDNIGITYRLDANYSEALKYHERALAIYRELGYIQGEAASRHNIGIVDRNSQKYSQSLDFLSEALVLAKVIGNLQGESVTLAQIAKWLEEQKRPKLAIIFYKQSLNVNDAFRQQSKYLPIEERQFYIDDVQQIYRSLAKLLLNENRVNEAQQIADLLKVEEINSYMGSVTIDNLKHREIKLLEPEKVFWKKYADLIDTAVKLHGKNLESSEGEVPGQDGLSTQEEVYQEIEQFINSVEVTYLELLVDANLKMQLENFDHINALQSQLRQQRNQDAVILYPLILEDKIQVILITANAPPTYHSVEITKEEVSEEITEFRKALTNRGRAELFRRLKKGSNSDNQVTEQALKFYEWLIKPIENELEKANAQTIIYAPDGELRYLPLGALYDGEKWLLQRFKINNITVASMMTFEENRRYEPTVLAGGLTTGTFDFVQGGKTFAFDYLDFADDELNNIAKAFPNTNRYVASNFTPEAIVPRMDNYGIVHLATHAAFVEGKPEDSFILFGNGTRVTLRDIKEWNLINVDLVVLSACQTGVGGILGNGEEVLGLGYQIQQAGARATIASLWRVDDLATHVLMDYFYNELKDGKSTIEALREAQNSLINSEFEHPYYWAPFILIGNGF